MYGYCSCNPVRLADPTGEDPQSHETMFRRLDTDRNGQLDSHELTSACVVPRSLEDFLLDESGTSRYTESGLAMRATLLEPFYIRDARQLRLYSDSPSPMTAEQHDAFVENTETARYRARLMGFSYWVDLVASSGLGGGGSAKGRSQSSGRSGPSRTASPRPSVREATSPSATRVRFSRTIRADASRAGGNTREPATRQGAYPASLGATARSRGVFMDRMLRVILSDPHHPLRFLINPETRNWRARTHLSEEPAVQAGHLTSRHSGEPERFAIEDAFFNQASSNRGETQGAVFYKQAVEIGGVPVETTTARLYQNAGKLK